MRVPFGRFAGLFLACAPSFIPCASSAQVSSFQACTPGLLANCAAIQLTSTLGAGAGGTNLFELAIRNLGSLSTPALPTSVYFLALLTGQGAATPGSEIDVTVVPIAKGGATVSSALGWSVFESGDAIFLNAPGNVGIGGCATSVAVGGYSQMGSTCGANAIITFSFSTTRSFTPSRFSLADIEVVATAPNNVADSCNGTTPCRISSLATVPEPATTALMSAGMLLLALVETRRRFLRNARSISTNEIGS